MPQLPFMPAAETGALADDIRTLFDDLATSLKHEQRAYSGECHPVLDVFETDTALAIIVDVSGVPAEAIRVLFRDGVVIIAGEKASAPSSPQQSYHLVEREFGRFARAVRIAGAFDVPRGTATLLNGELTITLPKRDERRGQAHRIAVSADRQP